jgi:hypothetical protein
VVLVWQKESRNIRQCSVIYVFVFVNTFLSAARWLQGRVLHRIFDHYDRIGIELWTSQWLIDRIPYDAEQNGIRAFTYCP